MSELQQLRDRVTELEEIVGVAGSLPHRLQDVLHLTPIEAQVLGYLMKRGTGAREGMFLAIYGAWPERSQPDIKILDVLVCRVRSVLKRHGVNVKTLWGVGWFMERADKEKLKQILERTSG